MPIKRYTPEQIIGMLRQAEIELAGGRTTGEVCRLLGISEQSYYRGRKEYGGLQVAQALKPIYQAETAELAAERLEAFDAGEWGVRYPAIAQAWRRKWEQVIRFFAFAPEVRRIIYTTNAIASLHSQVCKAVRGRGHFPSDKAATKLIYLVLQNVEAKWTRPPIAWHKAKAQFAIHFENRFVLTD